MRKSANGIAKNAKTQCGGQRILNAKGSMPSFAIGKIRDIASARRREYVSSVSANVHNDKR